MTEQDRVNNAAKNVEARKREAVANYAVPGEIKTQIMLAEKMPEKLASEQTKMSCMADIRASLRGLK